MEVVKLMEQDKYEKLFTARLICLSYAHCGLAVCTAADWRRPVCAHRAVDHDGLGGKNGNQVSWPAATLLLSV